MPSPVSKHSHVLHGYPLSQFTTWVPKVSSFPDNQRVQKGYHTQTPPKISSAESLKGKIQTLKFRNVPCDLAHMQNRGQQTDPSFISRGYLQDGITEALETSGASFTCSEVTVTRCSCRSKLSKVHWIPEYTTKFGDQCPLLPQTHRTSSFPTL